MPIVGARLLSQPRFQFLRSREGTDWEHVLEGLVAYRLTDPGSEWRMHRDWYANSAMGDLLGEGDALAAKDTLYRCLDLLLEHKRALFDRTGCCNITTAGNSLIKYGCNFDSKISFLLILTAFCESVWLFYRHKLCDFLTSSPSFMLEFFDSSAKLVGPSGSIVLG